MSESLAKMKEHLRLLRESKGKRIVIEDEVPDEVYQQQLRRDDTTIRIANICSPGWTFRNFLLSTTALRAIDRRAPMTSRDGAAALAHSSVALGLPMDPALLMTLSLKQNAAVHTDSRPMMVD